VDLDSFLAEAAELLAIPSTADRPAQLGRALDFIVGNVGPGFTVERFESNGKPSALLYASGNRGAHFDPATRKERSFRVILNAHLDVVPGEPEQFRPRRDGDRLYARGAHDMKVSALAEARAFRDLAADLPYPVALQLVTDEEVGGRDGTRHQIERGIVGDFVIIGEQTGLSIVADSKGLFQVALRATGVGGHSAYPWLGDNALLRVMAAVDRVMAQYPVPAAEAWRTTVNVARIDTSNRAFNQIPAEAEALLDVRYPPEDSDLNGRTVDEIVAHFAVVCGPDITVSIDRLEPPHRADRERDDIKVLQRATRRQGYAGAFLRKHGAGDGRFYSQRGIDAIAFGIGGGGQHGPDEYVDVATIVPYYRALTGFLTDLAPPHG